MPLLLYFFTSTKHLVKNLLAALLPSKFDCYTHAIGSTRQHFYKTFYSTSSGCFFSHTYSMFHSVIPRFTHHHSAHVRIKFISIKSVLWISVFLTPKVSTPQVTGTDSRIYPFTTELTLLRSSSLHLTSSPILIFTSPCRRPQNLKSSL